MAARGKPLMKQPKVAKDASTSTNNEVITQAMRQGYRTTLREKQALIEEIKHTQELLKKGGVEFEELKAEQLKVGSVIMESKGIVEDVTSVAEKKVAKIQKEKTPKPSKPPKPPKEKREHKERPPRPERPERPPQQERPKTERKTPATKEKKERSVKTPVVVHKKRIHEVEEDEAENTSMSSLIYSRELHKEIGAMHAAIQRRICMAGGFITFLIILILFN